MMTPVEYDAEQLHKAIRVSIFFHVWKVLYFIVQVTAFSAVASQIFLYFFVFLF